MIQRKYLYPVALLLLLVGIWTIGWFWLARVIANGLDEYAARQTGTPLAVAWTAIEFDGYPTRLYTHLAEPRATWSGPDGEIAWSGPETRLKFFTDFGRTVSFRAPGAHSFQLSGELAGGADRSATATGERLDGQLNFDDTGQISALRGNTGNLRVSLDGQPLTTFDDAAFDWSRVSGGTDPDAIHPESDGQTLTFSLSGVSLQSARLDPNLAETLGRKLERLAGRLSQRGALALDNPTPAELGRWRDAGGTLELSDFTLDWGPLRIAGAGTLALDAALQPVGSFTAEIAGLDCLLDLLERAGQIGSQQAAIARIALAVLTRAPADGGPAQARVSVTVQDRRLSIGPVTLLRLPLVTWD